jgi:SAM-dependent methyltransferase
LATAGYPLDSFHSILDFGCGCGRVLRFFPANRPPSSRTHGTDIDAEAIEWCTKNIPGVDWRANPFTPPLEYGDATFDFVFSISVFTHLNEEMQHAWLRELHRVTKPGGVLLLTLHGENAYHTLPAADQAKLRTQGILFVTGATGLLKLDGLPDFYQTTYHTRDYIDREWSKVFRIISYIPRGINAHQDAVLLQRQ